MADLQQQLQDLINDLPVEESVKSSLLAKLAEQGAAPEMVAEVRIALADAQVKLNKQYQPQVDQLKALEAQEKAAYDTYRLTLE